MQIFDTTTNLSQAVTARQNRESPRSVEPVDLAGDETVDRDVQNRLAPEQPPKSEPESSVRDSENYRLNFDPEKRQIFLELLNPVTGDVIQRVPRDDLAFAFAPPEDQPFAGVNVAV